MKTFNKKCNLSIILTIDKFKIEGTRNKNYRVYIYSDKFLLIETVLKKN